MRHLIFFVTLIFIPSTLVSAQSNDKTRNGFFGSVRSILEEKAKLENESGRMKEGPRLPVRQVLFDKVGNVIEQRENNPDGSFKSRLAWVLSYDSEGKEIEKEYSNADDKLTSKGVSTYDDSGKKIRLTHYNPNGSINHYQIYTYDDKGKIIEENHYIPGGSQRTQILYRYDEKGRKTEVIYKKPDGTVSQKTVFTYDDGGNKSVATAYDGMGVVKLQHASKYDSRGNLIELVNQGSGNGSIIKGTYRYEFDSVGNWIKRVTVREVSGGGNTQIENEVTYRAIVYY
jgi:hypothetical protein